MNLFDNVDVHGVTPEGFRPHPAILRWPGRLIVRTTTGPHPATDWHRMPAPPRWQLWETWVHVWPNHVWVGAKLESGSPVVELAAVMIAGDASNSAPVLDRHAASVELENFPAEPPKYVATLDPYGRGHTLNGQGVTIQACAVDFGTYEVTPAPHVPKVGIYSTDWILRYGSSTGGGWPSMGYRHDLDEATLEEWRGRLYSVLSWPGFVLRPGGDGFLREADRPDAVMTAGGHFHQKARDKGPIEYVDGDIWPEAGHDQNDKPMRAPDAQHLTHYSPILECATHWPLDLGFRIATKAIACRFPLQCNDRGPQAKYEVERGGGRPLLVACDLIRALKAHGELVLMLEVGDRAVLILRTMLGIFRARPTWPWDDFGGDPDKASVAETGMVWAGLRDVLRLAQELGLDGDDLLDDVRWSMGLCAKFCFDAFRIFPEGFGVPYTVNRDGTDAGSKSGATHFVWAAAVSHEHEPEDAWKKASLLEMEDRIPVKYR